MSYVSFSGGVVQREVKLTNVSKEWWVSYEHIVTPNGTHELFELNLKLVISF